MIRIHLNNKYLNPFSEDKNQTIIDWFDWLERQEPRKRGSSGDVMWMEINYLLLEHFLMIMELDGGKVEYFNPFVKVLDSAMDNEIPEGLSNRTYIKTITEATYDEEGNELTPAVTEEVVKTWRQWQRGNINPQLYDDGYLYVRSNYGNFNGASLSSKELLIIHNSTDAELVDETPKIEETF